ncbi:MAG: hypothetical protein QOH73_1182 [Gaiellaceae bacterium]|nr:hypothetical protein [Gaiellaceae bacterium]
MRAKLVTLGLVLASATAIGAVRGTLASVHQHVKEESDVYVLPPPDQVVTLSLGYRSALSDLLWAHVLVSQGLHTFERRRFENLSLFLDSINELEPTFREPYLLADALYTFQGFEPSHDEVAKARAVMERGSRELPLDGQIWLQLGQFVAFIAPGTYLTDEQEQQQWRLDGARMLARAAELGGENANITWQTLGAVGIFNRAGERDAAIRLRLRALAVTDDPELKDRLLRELGKLLSEEQKEISIDLDRKLVGLWKRDLPFVPRGTMLVLGPPVEPARCAGPGHERDPACAFTWRSWAERHAPSRGE